MREVDDTKLAVDLYGKVIAERVYEQLSNLSVIIIPDEIILTRRVLEPMHRFHKLAADLMLTNEFSDNQMDISLDSEQLRVLNWRASSKDIAGVVGPPGCGKTTVGSALAVKNEGLANRVLLVAYTNAAANEFCWELCTYLAK